MAKKRFQVNNPKENKRILGSGFESDQKKAAKRAENCRRQYAKGEISIVPAKLDGKPGYYWEVRG